MADIDANEDKRSIWDQTDPYEVRQSEPESAGLKWVIASVLLILVLAGAGWWGFRALVSSQQQLPATATEAVVQGRTQELEMRWLLWKSYLGQDTGDGGPAFAPVSGVSGNSLIVALASQLSRAQTWLLIGELELSWGSFDAARVAFENTLNLAPNDIYALTGLVRVLLQTEEYKAAADTVVILERRFPTNPLAAYARALYAAEHAEYGRALEALDIVLSNDARHAPSILLKGDVELRTGNRRQALATLSEYHQMNPASVPGRKLLARAFIGNSQAEQAIELLKPLVGDVRNDSEIASILVTAYDQVRNTSRTAAGSVDSAASKDGILPADSESTEVQEAVARLRFGLKKRSEPLQGLELLAVSHLRAGQVDEAFILTQSLLAEKPDDARLHYLQGVNSALRGDVVAAAEHYELARQLGPDFHAAELALPPIDQRLVKGSAILEQLEARRQEDRNALQARLELADIYLQRGGVAEALELGREISGIAPDNPVGNYLLASALILGGEAQAGLQIMEQLDSVYGGTQQSRWRLFEASQRAGNLEAAQNTLYEILAADEQDPRALVQLSLLERNSGHFQSSRAMAKRMRQYHPALSTGYLIQAQLASDELDYRSAIDLLEKSFELSGPSITVARWFMGLASGEHHDQEQILMQDWLAESPASGISLVLRSAESRRQAALYRTIEQYDWLARRESDNIAVLVLLAQAYRAVGDRRDVELMRQVVRQVPENGSFRYHLAVALSENYALGEAQQVLRELLASRIQFDERGAAQALLKRLES
jgi:predicted Zn-dependent protease